MEARATEAVGAGLGKPTASESCNQNFSNEGSAQRPIGALLAEKHETWSTGKSCYDTIEYPEARPEEEKQKIEQEIQTAS